jgi:hypothetical protein
MHIVDTHDVEHVLGVTDNLRREAAIHILVEGAAMEPRRAAGLSPGSPPEEWTTEPNTITIDRLLLQIASKQEPNTRTLVKSKQATNKPIASDQAQ